MIDEASDEIESIEGEDRMSVEVMTMRIKLYNQGKFWEALVDVSKYVADKEPCVVHGWSN